MRIICFGDSNTYGYDPTSPIGGTYGEEAIWTGRLAKAGFEVENFGRTGRQIPVDRYGLSFALSTIQLAEPFDLCIIMLGTNDFLTGTAATAEDAAARMDTFLTFLLTNDPVLEKKLFLISPPAMNRGEWVTEDYLLTESRRLSACYRKVAEKHRIGFADAATWGIDTAFDGVHMTAEGHRRFANALADELRNGHMPGGSDGAGFRTI